MLIVYIVGIYFLYVLISGVILFKFSKHKKSRYIDEHKIERFFGEKESQDKVALVEKRYESGLARINLIENAKETLDISYYMISPGLAGTIFHTSIVDAADRGVKIRILLDGLSHHMRGKKKDIIYSYSEHPNIQLKFYEPFDAWRPWTWNNRLHDKIIVVDREVAMIGGRNIGDKYFAPVGYEGATNDRDVVIVNTDVENLKDSVISKVKEYYDYVWNHKFSRCPVTHLTKKQQKMGQRKLSDLRELFKTLVESQPNLFKQEINWRDRSLPANKVTFIHNPIERFNKEPWVWYEISRLMRKAKESILIQSPYIIPTIDMQKHLNKKHLYADDVKVLTNSVAASPNVMAYSGYRRFRKKIVGSGVNVYEFQGPTESYHTKSFIFDNRISLVGSFNLDPRSAHLSTEIMVVIDSKPFANQMKSEIDRIITHNSLHVKSDGSYSDHPFIEEKMVSPVKSMVTRVLSGLTRFSEHLL
ncbi:phospholipase D-like domain-containing protein [Halalkalibacter alkalisediminis]|uniref:Phosphatidylserine/phosphatidylglycerophosphate/ cardiolipin synthase family protein n=1 Tax=Halalkalibacter alkalisediminis TaxID=935616 RepID=A0ABV6NIS1_9BACI|nr:phospholipase D family protein [Halalkalibacter alkalisediminis]